MLSSEKLLSKSLFIGIIYNLGLQRTKFKLHIHVRTNTYRSRKPSGKEPIMQKTALTHELNYYS